MSEATFTAPTLAALEFDVADRMRKALRVADVSVADMADYLGVSRNTVGRYINGHVAPDRRTLRVWAMRCGVPFDWLTTGQIRGGLPHLDSNQEPSDPRAEPGHHTFDEETHAIASLRKLLGHTGSTRPGSRSRITRNG